MSPTCITVIITTLLLFSGQKFVYITTMFNTSFESHHINSNPDSFFFLQNVNENIYIMLYET